MSGREVSVQPDGRIHWVKPEDIVDLLQPTRTGPQIGNAVAVPAGVDPDQFLSLEGDFDRHFRLYCPPRYEHDALYLFTPDSMALFIDRARGCAVEIDDNWLIVSGGEGSLRGSDPKRWTSTLDLIAAIEDKLAQWDRWRDESKPRFAPRGMPRALARPKPNVAAGWARLRALTQSNWVKRLLLVGAIVLGALLVVPAANFLGLLQ